MSVTVVINEPACRWLRPFSCRSSVHCDLLGWPRGMARKADRGRRTFSRGVCVLLCNQPASGYAVCKKWKTSKAGQRTPEESCGASRARVGLQFRTFFCRSGRDSVFLRLCGITSQWKANRCHGDNISNAHLPLRTTICQLALRPYHGSTRLHGVFLDSPNARPTGLQAEGPASISHYFEQYGISGVRSLNQTRDRIIPRTNQVLRAHDVYLIRRFDSE